MDKKDSNVIVIYATAIKLLKTDKNMAYEFIKANKNVIKFTDSQLAELELEAQRDPKALAGLNGT